MLLVLRRGKDLNFNGSHSDFNPFRLVPLGDEVDNAAPALFDKDEHHILELKTAYQSPLIVWHLLLEEIDQPPHLPFPSVDEKSGLSRLGFVNKRFFTIKSHSRRQRDIFKSIGARNGQLGFWFTLSNRP